MKGWQAYELQHLSQGLVLMHHQAFRSSRRELPEHLPNLKELQTRLHICGLRAPACGAEITAFASEERLGVDFSDIWAHSGLARWACPGPPFMMTLLCYRIGAAKTPCMVCQ